MKKIINNNSHVEYTNFNGKKTIKDVSHLTTINDNSLPSAFSRSLFKIILILFIAVFFFQGFTSFEKNSRLISNNYIYEYDYSSQSNEKVVYSYTDYFKLYGSNFNPSFFVDKRFYFNKNLGLNYGVFRIPSTFSDLSLFDSSSIIFKYYYNNSLIPSFYGLPLSSSRVIIDHTAATILNYRSSPSQNYNSSLRIFDNHNNRLVSDDFYIVFESLTLSAFGSNNSNKILSLWDDDFITITSNSSGSDSSNIVTYEYLVNYNHYDWSYKLSQLSNLKPIIDTSEFINSSSNFTYDLNSGVSYAQQLFNRGIISYVVDKNIYEDSVLAPISLYTGLYYDSSLVDSSTLKFLESDIGTFILTHYKPNSNGTLVRRDDNINDSFEDWSVKFKNDDFIFGEGFKKILYVLTLPISITSNIIYDLGVLLQFILVW